MGTVFGVVRCVFFATKEPTMKSQRIRQGQTWYSNQTTMTKRYVSKYYRHEPLGTNNAGVTVYYTDISLCHYDSVSNPEWSDLFVERNPYMCAPKRFLNTSASRRQSRRNTLLRSLSISEFCRAMQPGVRMQRPTFSQPER